MLLVVSVPDLRCCWNDDDEDFVVVVAVVVVAVVVVTPRMAALAGGENSALELAGVYTKTVPPDVGEVTCACCC